MSILDRLINPTHTFADERKCEIIFRCTSNAFVHSRTTDMCVCVCVQRDVVGVRVDETIDDRVKGKKRRMTT